MVSTLRWNFGIFTLAYVILAGLALPVVASDDEKQPLIFCDSHWPPFTYGDSDEQALGGYAVKFMEELSRVIDVPFKLTVVPWKRCLHSARNGDVDGIMLLTENPERVRFLSMTEPLLQDTNLLWYRADSELAKARPTFESMQGLKIGIVPGFNYGTDFDDAVKRLGLTVEESPTVLSNFQKLSLGRSDVFLANKLMGEYTLKGHRGLRSQLVHQPGPFQPVNLRIGLAHAGRANGLLNTFNQAIWQMETKGRIAAILNQAPLDQDNISGL